jgi:hypothetical protein
MRWWIFLLAAGSLFSACKVSDYSSSARPVSHQLWDSLLQAHVTDAGQVDYRGFQSDSLRMSRYLALLRSHHPNDAHWSREEQLAYWINAYNAFTVQLILQHYPVRSIKDIKKGIPFLNSVWDLKFIRIEERTYDLNNIEHGILRRQFEEPRIHFALNCASVSCPTLWNHAYTAKGLDGQLDRAARAFLQDPQRNRIRPPDRAELSKIFAWYKGDFEPDLITYLNTYLDPPLPEDAAIEFLDYDWGLNAQESAGEATDASH